MGKISVTFLFFLFFSICRAPRTILNSHSSHAISGSAHCNLQTFLSLNNLFLLFPKKPTYTHAFVYWPIHASGNSGGKFFGSDLESRFLPLTLSLLGHYSLLVNVWPAAKALFARACHHGRMQILFLSPHMH
jgi:hypothetical protein